MGELAAVWDWFKNQGALGVMAFVTLAVAGFLWRDNRSLTNRLIAKSETSEKLNKEAADEMRAFLDELRKRKGVQRRPTAATRIGNE